MKWVRRLLLYPLGVLAAFILFAYWTFPYERLTRFVVHQVETKSARETRTPSGYELEIIDLSPSWFTGIDLEGVRLVSLPQTAEERPTDITFEWIEARVGLLSALTGGVDLDLETSVAGGTLALEIDSSSEGMNIWLDASALDLRRASILKTFTNLPIRGTLTSQIDLALMLDPTQSDGTFDIQLTDASIGDGTSPLSREFIQGLVPARARAFVPGNLVIPELHVGALQIAGTVTGGEGQFSRFVGRGSDLLLDSEGGFNLGAAPQTDDPLWPKLQRGLLSSTIDSLFRIQFSERYIGRNEEIAALFSLLQRTVEDLWTSDGAIQIHIVGAPSRFRYDRVGGREGPASAASAMFAPSTEMSSRRRSRMRGQSMDEPAMSEATDDSAMNEGAEGAAGGESDPVMVEAE